MKTLTHAARRVAAYARRGLAIGLLATLGILGVAVTTAPPASANALQTAILQLGSCKFSFRISTVGSGSTYIRAENSGCLHIRIRRSGNQTWAKVSNPVAGGTLYTAQGGNTWIEVEAKSEITVTWYGQQVDTYRARYGFGGYTDSYSAAPIIATSIQRLNT